MNEMDFLNPVEKLVATLKRWRWKMMWTAAVLFLGGFITALYVPENLAYVFVFLSAVGFSTILLVGIWIIAIPDTKSMP